jgi:hypothetical protein
MPPFDGAQDERVVIRFTTTEALAPLLQLRHRDPVPARPFAVLC